MSRVLYIGKKVGLFIIYVKRELDIQKRIFIFFFGESVNH